MKYFKKKDFDCKQTGENDMKPMFLMRLDVLRGMCGFPFIVISGFRSVKHSAETKKAKPGQHTKGIATDVQVQNGIQRMIVVKFALAMGFRGIGVGKNIVHLDDRETVPVMWVY
jgi:uncharacterized protein YcbK (DUF882 family)